MKCTDLVGYEEEVPSKRMRTETLKPQYKDSMMSKSMQGHNIFPENTFLFFISFICLYILSLTNKRFIH